LSWLFICKSWFAENHTVAPHLPFPSRLHVLPVWIFLSGLDFGHQKKKN